jgi:hypothetical protein
MHSCSRFQAIPVTVDPNTVHPSDQLCRLAVEGAGLDSVLVGVTEGRLAEVLVRELHALHVLLLLHQHVSILHELVQRHRSLELTSFLPMFSNGLAGEGVDELDDVVGAEDAPADADAVLVRGRPVELVHAARTVWRSRCR